MNLFKKKEVIEKPVERSIMVSDFKQEIITELRKDIEIKLADLFVITQDCKALMDYSNMSDADKYKIEKYQDMILYYAQNYNLK